MTQGSFWDSSVWSLLIVFSVLLGSLLLANLIKKTVPFLKKSLIPSSVLGGIILLIISSLYYVFTKDVFFNLPIFGSSSYEILEDGTSVIINKTGTNALEVITYHFLGIGFVAMALRDNKKPIDKESTKDIFNSGCATVAGYLLQAVLGLGITIVAGFLSAKVVKYSGIILPFGYGQGTGQALNYGTIYEKDFGFVGGSNFGLTIAALGFLSASIGGVIFLNYLRRKGKVAQYSEHESENLSLSDIQTADEIEMNGSIDKFTIQLAAVLVIYIASYALMALLGNLLPSFKSVFFGFNFLIGTALAMLVKWILKVLNKKGIVKKKYLNTFMMNRIGGTAFDIMIVAGIAVIQIQLIKEYWWILLILGVLGAVATFFYILFVSKVLFKNYSYEEFFAMYGMLTGTASTGVILLREIDPDLKTPASNNLIFQTLPAILFGFPMMLLATYCPSSDTAMYITLGICFLYFIFMNVVLFRSVIFKKKSKRVSENGTN